MPEMITRVEQLLTAMGLTWSYADAIAKRMFRVERVAWLREPAHLQAIIAALYNEQRKRALFDSIERDRKALGLDDKAWQALTSHRGKGWTRNVRALQAVAAELDARLLKLRELEARP
jgi:hypothetical protein